VFAISILNELNNILDYNDLAEVGSQMCNKIDFAILKSILLVWVKPMQNRRYHAWAWPTHPLLIMVFSPSRRFRR